MKNLIHLILVLTAITMAGAATANTLKINKERTIYITGTVDASTIGTANKLLKMTEKDKSDVWIIINSGGGTVIAGMQVINIMRILKKRDITINCLTPMLAASMAFQIFAECSNRYAFQYSLFLWHPIRVSMGFGSVLTPDRAEALAADMRRYEKFMVDDLKKVLDISDETFHYHYVNETMHIAVGLKELSPEFLTIVDDAVGVGNLFKMRF